MEDQFEYSTDFAKENFSFLMLATGQGSIKRYIGLTEKWNQIDFDEIIPKENHESVKRLFVWMYGNKDKTPVIKESRDITGKLSPVLNHKSSTQFLEENDDLEGAYERSDGDEKLLNKYMSKTLRLLDNSFSLLLDKGFNDEIKLYVEKIEKRIEQINKLSRTDD